MALPWPPAPPNSWCAIHPGMPAAASCPRCGNFACDECTSHGAAEFCPGCAQRLGAQFRFPLRRDNWSVNAVLEYGWSAFQREWLMLSLAALIVLGGSLALGLVGNLVQVAVAPAGTAATIAAMVASFGLQYGISGFLTMGLARICVDVLEGRRADLAKLFSQGGKMPSYLLVMLILGLAIIVPAAIIAGAAGYLGGHEVAFRIPVVVGLSVFLLLFTIAAVYLGIALYPVTFELAVADTGAVGAIRNCFTIARGQRLPLFGVEIVAGLAVMAGTLACCIGMFPGFALGQLFIGGVYLALRRGSGIEPQV